MGLLTALLYTNVSKTDAFKFSVSVCLQFSTFEVLDTVSQFPPVSENFPEPIRRRISSGVSLGPLANGVYLTSRGSKVRWGRGTVRNQQLYIWVLLMCNKRGLTRRAWCRATPPGSKCHTLRRNLVALVPMHKHKKTQNSILTTYDSWPWKVFFLSVSCN